MPAVKIPTNIKGGKRDLIKRAQETRGVKVENTEEGILLWRGFLRKEAKVYSEGARALERAVRVTAKSLTFVNPARMVMESVAEFSPINQTNAEALLFDKADIRPNRK